jgi:hypothetical protein
MHLHFTQFQVLNRQSIDVDRYVVAAGYDGTPGSGLMPPPAAGPYLTPGSAPRPPAANERGWKDTVVALPGEAALPGWLSQWAAGFAGFLHRFFMIAECDRSIRARGWRYPGGTGQR